MVEIAAVLAAVIGLLLYLVQFRHQTHVRSLWTRWWSVAISGFLLLWMGEFAAPVSRVVWAIALTVFFRESFYLLKWNDRWKWFDTGLDYAPVLIPLAFIYPYMAQITYFFGLDFITMVFAGTVILAYAGLHGPYRPLRSLVINGWLVVSMAVLLGWQAFS